MLGVTAIGRRGVSEGPSRRKRGGWTFEPECDFALFVAGGKNAMRVEFHGLQFELPQGWEDITDDLDDKWPPTLAGPAGVGALQFSVGRYKSGKLPNIIIGDLREMLANFCANLPHEFDEPVERAGPVNAVGCAAHGPEQLVAVWLLSNGRDVTLATYTSLSPEDPETGVELRQARQLVESIEF
ncbi:hypothetical protein DPM33_26920 [Mesorhizobium hawassense]|uniref:Uncharacterized protein n=1 Tax=Mesorhizobium hawassense TaxID=1209954 RepID=A0A330HH76_9HYPH|nr:hypothetical protein [Mesorhizobium hawassense]RAZ86978.1 hypothetical protein DPM33_26920 [Mesorhizobium hawassense]